MYIEIFCKLARDENTVSYKSHSSRDENHANFNTDFIFVLLSLTSIGD